MIIIKPYITYDVHVMESFEFESGKVLENVVVEYGLNGVPRYDDDGNKLILDENTELKIKQAQSLLADLMSIWDSKNLVVDFDDLNEKLGLNLK